MASVDTRSPLGASPAPIPHVCRRCRTSYPARKGKCDRCGSWNMIVPLADAVDLPMQARALVDQALPPLVETSSKAFNRVFGGLFIVQKEGGALYLVGGPPGSGKSTLLLQILGSWEETPHVYITCEETREAVAYRAIRFGVPKAEIIARKRLSEVVEILSLCTTGMVCVVDSLQKIDVPGCSAASASAAKTAVAELRAVAEKYGLTILIVCHVTKDDDYAGPKTVEHDVDAAAMIYHVGATARLLRCENKNRFAPSGTSAWMKMTAEGLVDTTPEVMLPPGELAGRVLSISGEGLPVEVQAVELPGRAGQLSVGVEAERVRMVQMSLGIRGKWMIRADGDALDRDPNADLAIAIAMLSAVRGTPLPPKTVAWGQLTLDGRIISGPAHEERASSARDLELVPILSPDHFKTVDDALAVLELSAALEEARQADERGGAKSPWEEEEEPE